MPGLPDITTKIYDKISANIYHIYYLFVGNTEKKGIGALFYVATSVV